VLRIGPQIINVGLRILMMFNLNV